MQNNIEYTYLGFSNQKNICEEVSQNEALEHYKSYRKIEINNKPLKSDIIFQDLDFNYQLTELQNLDSNQSIIWMRLGDLVKPQGSLFYFQNISHFNQNQNQNQPSFLYQVGLLPVSYYKTLFVTPNFKLNGAYQVIVNMNGHFKKFIVDDKIPVIQKTYEPIWGMQKNISWELILLKVWAKVLGGYKNVKKAKAFDFLKAFSYPNWKLKNIENEQKIQNLQKYFKTKLQQNRNYEEKKRKIQKIIPKQQQIKSETEIFESELIYYSIFAKTKNNIKVKLSGLTPNCGAYQIVQILKFNQVTVLKIKSAINNRWNGKFSILDNKINQFYNPQVHLDLNRSFIISIQDFRELFNFIMISPIHFSQIQNVKHTYQTVYLPSNYKKSQYFQFQLKKPSKVDINILQSEQCHLEHYRVLAPSQKLNSQITPQEQNYQLRQIKLRYLYMKILIAKVDENCKPRRVSNIENETGPNKNASIINQSQNQFEFIYANYSKGNNSGDSYLSILQQGKYILRLKSESINRAISYTVNLVSNEPVRLSKLNLNPSEKSLILKAAFLNDCIDKDQEKVYLNNKKQWIYYGNYFNEVGYGVVCFYLEQSSYKLYCQFNPKLLFQEGYRCKDTYKNQDKIIGLFSSKGIGHCIVLKKIKQKTEWPPQNIKFYRVQCPQ